MTEWNSSHIAQASAVHAGSGDQLILQMKEAAFRIGAREQDPLAIAANDRLRLFQRFVYPSGFRRAREILEREGTVLLTGQPGSGRRAAALVLLHELSQGAGNFHELPDTWDDNQQNRALDPSMIGEGDRLLLDLSGVDAEQYATVQKELSAFRSVLADRSACLVVVLPLHLMHRHEADLHPLTAEIEIPPARAVLMRHLHVEGIRLGPADMTADLTAYLTHATVGDVAVLAAKICAARDSAGPDESFPAWLERALGQATDRSDKVAADLAELTDGRRRALMLTVAMLHGFAPDKIFNGATTLLGLLKHPNIEQPRLDHADFAAELKSVGATKGENGAVTFGTPMYDAAVRSHFWTYSPDLRETFRDWTEQLVAWPSWKRQERTDLVSRFASVCLAAGRPEDLWWLAEQWTRRHGTRLLPDATQALAEWLKDDRHGRALRQKIYFRVTDSGLPDVLKNVLVVVCENVMSLRHPDQALVRLHHMARRERGTPCTAADAVLRLAMKADRLLLLLLGRLAPAEWPTDAEMFLKVAGAIAQQRRLYANPTIRTRLADGWSQTLGHHHTAWTQHVRSWLAAASAAGPYRESLLRLLVRSACRHPGVPARLHVIARDWAHAAPAGAQERSSVADCLNRQIDAAQGINTASFASQHTTGGAS